MNGAAFKERRLALGFTLRDVEQITDGAVSNAYLSQLETGKIKNPSVPIILSLCAAYALSHETALEWVGAKSNVSVTRVCECCGQAIRALASQPTGGEL